jgi:hypothetical protein
VVPERLDLLGGERPGPAGELDGGAWPANDDVTDAEVTDEGEAGDVGKAERAANVDWGAVDLREQAGDGGRLALDTVDEPALVAAGDGQDLAAF